MNGLFLSMDGRYFLIIVITSTTLYSQVTQQWVNRYNGTANSFDIAVSLKLDNQQGIYVFGSTSSAGSSTDIVIIKYLTSGAMQWQQVFNGNGNSADNVKKGCIDNYGNSYLTGFSTDSAGTIKIITLKCSPSGILLWHRLFLQTGYIQGFGQDILVDNSSNVFTCGYMRRPNGTYDIVILKYSSEGNLLSSSVYNVTSSSTEIPVSMCRDSSGSLYVLGTTNSVSGYNDILMLKYNSNLDFLLSNVFSGSATADDKAVKIITDRTGKLVILASPKNISSNYDYGVYRFDTSFNLIMQFNYNGAGNHQDIPYDIVTDIYNNIYVTGSSRNADTLGSEDIVTLKVNQGGGFLWSRFYNGVNRGIDYGISLALDLSQNIYVGGTTDEHEGHQMFALLKYRPNGDLDWLKTYSAQYQSEDFISEISVDNGYNIFVTGISFDSTSDYDITTIKYSQPIGIHSNSVSDAGMFRLYQNSPNPFNSSTRIRFSVPVHTKTSLKIYDVLGRQVNVLFDDLAEAGTHEFVFDVGYLPSGIYFCIMVTEKISQIIKMLFIK
jgi:hypothetical protein